MLLRKIAVFMLIVSLVLVQLGGAVFVNAATNLALSKSITASTNNVDTKVLVDGNTKSTDIKETCLIRNGSFLTIDLGSATEINMLNLFEFNYYGSRRLNGYKLEGSDDGQKWSVLSETDNSVIVCSDDIDKKNYSGSIVFSKAKVRYVKITFKSVIDVRNPATASVGYLSEIEIYNDSTAVVKDEPAQTTTPSTPTTSSTTKVNNLAFNKKVAPNVARSNNDHVMTVDGKSKVTGSNDTWIVSNNSSLTIDLGAKSAINQVKIYEYNYYQIQRIYGYVIACSPNGKDSWKTVAEGNNDEKVCSEKISSDHFLGTITFETVESQYIKIILKNTINEKEKTKPALGYIAEIEAYNDPSATPSVKPPVVNEDKTTINSDNIALNCKVFTDLAVSTPDGVIENAVDGDITTSLKVQGSLKQTKGHIMMDLGAEANFNKVFVIDLYNRIKEYKINISSDGKTWKDVIKGNATGNEKKIEFDTVLARYVDFEITQTDISVCISEIQVFNSSDKPTYPNGNFKKPVVPELEAPKSVDKVPFTKENFHIYLFIGQSNMNGRDIIPFEERVALNRTYLLNDEEKWEIAQPYYYPNSPHANFLYGYNRYSTVVDPTKEQIDGLNPASSFSKAMIKSVPENIGIGIVSNARGGTSVAKWQKNSGYEFDLYGEAVKRAKKAIELGGTLKGIFWLQGEGDANTPEYLGKLNNIASGIRSELGVSANDVPFIASQNPPNYYVNNERIVKIADFIENSDWISSAGTSTIDETHFTSESMHLLGLRYAVKALDKVYNFKIDEKQLNANVYNNNISEYIASAGKYDYKILVNGMPLVIDVEPVMVNDRLLVPLRAIFERLNATVEWDENTQTITATKDTKVIKLTIGSNNIIINGVSSTIDVAPQVISDRTLVPLRVVAESFGAKVGWEDDIKTATISTQ